MKMEKNHLIDYQQIERTVRRAGAVMKEAHLSADAVRRKEGAANFVTKYDVEIQKFLMKELHGILPEAEFRRGRDRGK